MPISFNSESCHSHVNGDGGNGISLNSLDDEESFVVLERSTTNDVQSFVSDIDLLPNRSDDLQTLLSGQPSQSIRTSTNCAFPVFNNVASSTMTTSRACYNNQMIPVEPLGLPFDSTNISVSAEEIEKKLQEVLLENINLKENLYQTNLAMKQQLSTVSLLQDRSVEAQKKQQSKFEETKSLILMLGSEKNELQENNNFIVGELNKLKEENKELKLTNAAFGVEAGKLLSENASLKKQLSNTEDTLQKVTENSRKTSLQPTPKEMELHELVDQLTRKLEVVERARRQQEFDIDKLQAQLGRVTQELNELQQKLADSKSALQAAQTQLKSDSLPYGEKLLKYDGLLKQLKISIQEEQTRLDSLNSWLTMTDPAGNLAQFEISELRRLLAEEQAQSVSRKENLYIAVSTIHELLGDFQKLGEDLERVKADHALKQSHCFTYDEMQKKGFNERLDSLTAKLVEKEEALAISERHLASLQEAVRLQNDEKKDQENIEALNDQVHVLNKEVSTKDEKIRDNAQEINSLKAELECLRTNTCDTISVLEEQARIFQADFDAERKSRELLVAEKERLMEDLRHLQNRNQELIDELSRLQNSLSSDSPLPPANTNPRRQEQSPSFVPPKPRQRQYFCPNSNCNQGFNTLEDVNHHVIQCWGLPD